MKNKRDEILTVPACATDVSQIINKIDKNLLRSMFTTNGACDPRRLDVINLALIERDICSQGLQSEACFYPLGGADSMTPCLLTDAPVTLMTGFENWGCVSDIAKLKFNPLVLFGFGGTTDNLPQNKRGTFDSAVAWHLDDEEGRKLNTETSLSTMGPHAIMRAVAAEMIQGKKVQSVHVAKIEQAKNADFPCLLDRNEEMKFSKMTGANGDYDRDVAFWLTMEDGQKKAYLYKGYHLKDDDYLREQAALREGDPMRQNELFQYAQDLKRSEQSDIHKILSMVCNDNGLTIIEKGIPKNILDGGEYGNPVMQTRAEELFSPPKNLVKAIICDEKEGKERTSQKVCVEGLETQSLDLSPYDTAFGYGDRMFIHSKPGILPKIALHAYAKSSLSKDHQVMFEHDRSERHTRYVQSVVGGGR